MNSNPLLRDGSIEWREFIDSHSQNHSEHWPFRCPAKRFPTTAWIPLLTRSSLLPIEAHSDYWKVFPLLSWNLSLASTSWFSPTIKPRAGCWISMTILAISVPSPKELSGQQTVWADSHLRAIDSSHWNRTDDIRVSFHRSALQVLEDSNHLLHPSFYFQSFFVSYMTLSKLPSLSSFFPLAVAFIHWLWPLFLMTVVPGSDCRCKLIWKNNNRYRYPLLNFTMH